MACIVRDDESGTSGQRQFQEQIVLGVGEMRPPEKINPAFNAFPEKVIQEIANILGGVSWQQSRAGKYILVLQAKWWGDHRLKLRRAELLDESE